MEWYILVSQKQYVNCEEKFLGKLKQRIYFFKRMAVSISEVDKYMVANVSARINTQKLENMSAFLTYIVWCV